MSYATGCVSLELQLSDAPAACWLELVEGRGGGGLKSWRFEQTSLSDELKSFLLICTSTRETHGHTILATIYSAPPVRSRSCYTLPTHPIQVYTHDLFSSQYIHLQQADNPATPPLGLPRGLSRERLVSTTSCGLAITVGWEVSRPKGRPSACKIESWTIIVHTTAFAFIRHALAALSGECGSLRTYITTIRAPSRDLGGGLMEAGILICTSVSRYYSFGPDPTASSLLITSNRRGPSRLKSTSTHCSWTPFLPVPAASSSGPGRSNPSTTLPSSLRLPPLGGCTVGLMHFSVQGVSPDRMKSTSRFRLASSSPRGACCLDILPYAVGEHRPSRCCAT